MKKTSEDSELAEIIKQKADLEAELLEHLKKLVKNFIQLQNQILMMQVKNLFWNL